MNRQNVFENNGKNNKHIKIALLARSKLDSIEKLISNVLIDSDITCEEFMAVIMEKRNYFRSKKRQKKISWMTLNVID